MDVTKLKVAATGTIHVKDASGAALYDGENPVRIVVHAPGSRAFSALEAKQTARALNRLNANDGKPSAVSPEQYRAEVAEDLASITIAFEHLSCDSKEGVELFEAVYGDPQLGFIPKQVNKFIGDWGSFQQGSSAS